MLLGFGSSYSQSVTIDYTYSSLGSGCNIFSTPQTIQGHQHSTSFGYPRFLTDGNVGGRIILDGRDLSGATQNVTQYVIAYNFKIGYTYKIRIYARTETANVFGSIGLKLSTSNSTTNTSTACNTFASQGDSYYINGYSNVTLSSLSWYTVINSTGALTQNFGFLYILASPNPTTGNEIGVLKSVSIQKIEITETPPPVSVYYNVSKSGTFTRNNCSVGYAGSAVTYNVAAGAYTSTISQADADQKAQNDVNTNGQAYANANGTCTIPTTYFSVEKSGSFTRNNCGGGYLGSVVTYTIAAGAYTSTISQADADQKAQNDINTNGQAYANTNGVCVAGGTLYVSSGSGMNMPYTVTFTNISNPSLNNSFSIYPGSNNYNAGSIAGGAYNVTVAPQYPFSTTIEMNFNGTVYSGTTFNLSNVNISGNTNIGLSLPVIVGDCVFAEANGFDIISSRTDHASSNNTATGYINWTVAYGSSAVQPNTNVKIATFTCNKPSVARVITATENGRSWQITFTPSGEVWATFTGGAPVSGSGTVTFYFTYNM